MHEDRSIRTGTAKITVKDIGTFVVETGLNLREALRREGFYIDGTCADQGTCGRCVVRVVSGDTRAPGKREEGILDRDEVESGFRLACRVTVTGHMEIAVSGERILEIEKTGRWKEVWDSPLWTSHPFPLTESGFGVALDLGTTSIAAALYDLDRGRPLDIRSAANPQVPWGDEIISRLAAAARDEGTANTLRNLLWQKVREIVRTLCLRCGVSAGRVSRVVAVGNSAVHHLALGLTVGSFLEPPYNPSDTGSRELKAGDPPVEMKLAAESRIYFPPLAGGYAGSDAVVSLMAALSQGVPRGAVIDVGTNTEIAVWDAGRCLVATAPSGPAFEGGHIRAGMQAEEGAIWRVRIGEKSVHMEVLGGGTPRGICGTGIVDAVAGMLRAGLLEPSGLMRRASHPNMTERGFCFDPPKGVALESQDIATVQKAKAAIAATLRVLLGRLDMGVGDLQRVYLAGAFGTRLAIESAVTLGMFPTLKPGSYVPAGNTALVGASLVLLSQEAQGEAERLGRTIEHVSVAEDDKFEDLFLDNLYFPQAE